MKLVVVPGYRELFGETKITYEELIKHIPSEIIISVLISLNNELNVPTKEITDSENQKRLRELLSERFTQQQSSYLNNAYYNYGLNTNGTYNAHVFARQYLLVMILKELNNYRDFELEDTTGNDEFNILIAYLLVIDEVNFNNKVLLDEALTHQGDSLLDYRMLWTPSISQYEFNEKTNTVYELFRLIAFSKYTVKYLRGYLKEYLNGFNFKNIAELLCSLYQLSMTTLNYQKDEILKKLNYIKPAEGIDDSHLNLQAINALVGKKLIVLDDLRKKPFYFNKRNGYMFIDEDIYNKKCYKGPFFELYYNTTLKNYNTILKRKMTFNEYSTDISLQVLEKNCFQSLCKALQDQKAQVVKFDDNGIDSFPDCYMRNNKSIMLFEFKGYVFPNALSAKPDFDVIKKYIDERFVENENGKAKGVNQLINQISLLAENKFDFDYHYKENFYQKRLTIYPIIIHSEFHFSMPGVNSYLNELFQFGLTNELKDRFIIKPLILINLEIIFDFVLTGGNFASLEKLFDRYLKIIDDREKRLRKQPSTDNFFRTKSSFDEIYRSVLLKDLKVPKKRNDIIKELIGISQEEIDEVL